LLFGKDGKFVKIGSQPIGFGWQEHFRPKGASDLRLGGHVQKKERHDRAGRCTNLINQLNRRIVLEFFKAGCFQNFAGAGMVPEVLVKTRLRRDAWAQDCC